MADETRTIYLDPDLEAEAYRFKGITTKVSGAFS